MMDFSQLADAGQSTDNLKARRQELFAKHYRQAREALNRFNQKGLYASEDLQEAVSELLAALVQRRTHPEPYLFLAYAMAVFKAPVLAGQYLKIARELGASPQLLSSVSTALLQQSQSLQNRPRS